MKQGVSIETETPFFMPYFRGPDLYRPLSFKPCTRLT